MGRVRLGITPLPIPRYTLSLKCCCVFWTWVTFHSYHCVQIEVRQEISITKHGGWREVIHWILWSWKTVWNGLTVSMTHKMLELIWRTESLQYVVCSLDLKKWRLERLKYENIFLYLSGGKKIAREQERHLSYSRLVLSVTSPGIPNLKSKGNIQLTSKVRLVHDLLLLLKGPSDVGEE